LGGGVSSRGRAGVVVAVYRAWISGLGGGVSSRGRAGVVVAVYRAWMMKTLYRPWCELCNTLSGT